MFQKRAPLPPPAPVNWLLRVTNRAGEFLQRGGQELSFPRGCAGLIWGGGGFQGVQRRWGLPSLGCPAGSGHRGWPRGGGDAGGDLSPCPEFLHLVVHAHSPLGLKSPPAPVPVKLSASWPQKGASLSLKLPPKLPSPAHAARLRANASPSVSKPYAPECLIHY